MSGDSRVRAVRFRFGGWGVSAAASELARCLRERPFRVALGVSLLAHVVLLSVLAARGVRPLPPSVRVMEVRALRFVRELTDPSPAVQDAGSASVAKARDPRAAQTAEAPGVAPVPPAEPVAPPSGAAPAEAAAADDPTVADLPAAPAVLPEEPTSTLPATEEAAPVHAGDAPAGEALVGGVDRTAQAAPGGSSASSVEAGAGGSAVQGSSGAPSTAATTGAVGGAASASVSGAGGGPGIVPAAAGETWPSGGAAGRSLTGEELARLRSRIDSRKVYPQIAVRNGWEGEVVVELELGLGGNLEDVKVVRGSGYPILDKATMVAVRRAAPYPPLEGRVTVPVDYRLVP